MYSRRSFLKKSALFGLGGLLPFTKSEGKNIKSKNKAVNKPIVISTWNLGLPSNEAAWKVLADNGSALDAVETGVQIPEGDPSIHTVGYGGYPDRDGYVTLDSCIMDHTGNAGSVACIQHIKHPIKVARKVMEDTPHVMLVGEGALQFALEQGFKKEDLLTPEAKKAWKKWLKKAEYKPVINIENHDTIGMLALDADGNLSGGVTTSGLAWKMHGRVGDSPIIGAGLFVDNEVGAACSTGVGEEVIKTVGSHTVVEMLRQGYPPEEACKEAVERVVKINPGRKDYQVAYIALTKNGDYGGYAIRNGFNYAVCDNGGHNRMHDSKSLLG